MPAPDQLSRELETLVKITEILTGDFPFLEKCEGALSALASFTDSDLVTLREFDSDECTLNLIASYLHRVEGEDFQVPLSVTTSLSARALEANTPIVIDDYSVFDNRHQGYANVGMNSALAIPIYVDGELFGSLGLGARSTSHYKQEMVPVAVAIAAMVGMMIAKAELQEFNQVEANIGRIVSAPLVGPDVFQRFAEEAAQIIDYDRMALNSIDIQEQTYITEFLFGDEVPDYAVGVVRQFDRTGLEMVVRTKAGQRVRFDDPGRTGRGYQNAGPFLKVGRPFLLSVPLIVGDQVIGTLGFNRGLRPFSQKDLAKAERLGNLVAGAFADFNLREYKNRVEAEINRNRAILEAEAAIGKILSTPLNISGASEALVSEIDKLIPLDYFVIVAVDLESETFTSDFQEFLHNPWMMVQHNYGKPYAGSITAEVVKSGKGLVLDFDDPKLVSGTLPRAQALIDLGYPTIMSVPLVFDDSIIGAIILGSRREKAYNDEDLALADRIGNLLSGALATYKITSERNRALTALSESETRFRQIADSISGVFWLTELNPGRLIYASPNFEGLWGIPIDDVYEDIEQWLRTIHPEDKPRLLTDGTWAATPTEDDYAIEYRIIREDGAIRWIRSLGFPIKDENGNAYRITGISEDVTEQKIELERIVEGGRLISIGELASGVAHEINNPLAAINLYSESLIEQDLPEEAKEDLKIISVQAKRAATIVRNLLQFARKSSPETTAVNSRDFIERCVGLKNHDFRVNNISASTNILMDVPEIKIDEQLMTQVVVNILTNAEQACFGAHGRGHISIAVRKVNTGVRIEISDDGPGISAENQLKVFDPFFTTKEVGFGTGLGLSVSYGIITQMGGELWVESDGVSGSTFLMDIPSAVIDDNVGSDDQFGGAEFASESRLGSGSRLRLLLVDDEPDLRNIMARVLERNSHSVEQARDGEEAWKRLQEQEYDCILLDLRMPGTGGEELYKHLSASDPVTASKIIFVTGDLANGGTDRFLRTLPNQVLEKPISVDDLERALDAVSQIGLDPL